MVGIEAVVTESTGSGQIQSVHRALKLLSFFAPGPNGQAPTRDDWSVSELARQSGLHKSVVARLMATLAADGFVVQDPKRRTYQVGPQAYAVGVAYKPHLALDRIARPIMEELTSRCGHASYIGVPTGADYMYVISVESTQSVRVTIEEGERRAYHTSAVGKILLADRSDEEIRELLGPDPLPPMTEKTITSVDDFLKDLESVRQTGIAYNWEESMLAAGSVAVGIRDSSGGVIGGLAICYPLHVVAENELGGLIDQVVDAGARISRQLKAKRL